MILSDQEIKIGLNEGQIVIEPRPDEQSAYDSTSVDLRLHETGGVWKSAAGMPIQPGASGYSYTNVKDRIERVELNRYPLKPQSFLLAWTLERIELPTVSRLAARVEGKSSLARLGIGIHVTAPKIHAGFKGNIQLEIFNFGPNEILLDAGMRICQLIFEQTTGTPDRGYEGLFLDQAAGV